MCARVARSLRALIALTLGAAAVHLGCGRAVAQDPIDLKALMERMDRLERQNAELRQTLQEQQRILSASGSSQSLKTPAPADVQPAAASVTAVAPAPAGEVVGPPLPEPTVPTPQNIEDELGLRSRGGVYETAIERKLLGAGREAGWDNGFFIRTPDGSNWLRIGADFETDFRGFPDRQDSKDVDSFLVRRARINTDAVLGTYYDFRLMMDFSQKQSNTNDLAVTIIQDAYVNVHYWDAFQFMVGKFKQPIGYEQLIQDRATPFLERSMFDQLLPGRDVGIEAHGEFLFDGRLDWNIALANGEVQNLDFDQNDKKDLTFRLLLRPFNGSWEVSWLKRLQFGIEATTGVESENFSPSAVGGTGFTIRTPGTVPWLVFNNAATDDVLLNGPRTRWAPEVSYFVGPLGCAYQYYFESQEMQIATTATPKNVSVNLPLKGYDALMTVNLTGERRETYTQPMVPLHPFNPTNPDSGCGAWEFGVRVSRVAFDPVVFESFNLGSARTPIMVSLANPNGNSSGATEMTLGLNWYWTRNIKMQFNYEHDWFDQGVNLGGPPTRHNDAILTRFAVLY